MIERKVGVWFPAIRSHSGADVFTERLCVALNARGIRAEITWLPLRAEYAPWSVPKPKSPGWATVAHVNSTLPQRFWPKHLPVVCTVHHSCYQYLADTLFKHPLQRLYHRLWIYRVEQAAIECAQCVTAVSHSTARAVKAVFGSTSMTVIYNGVDTTFFTPSERNQPNSPFRLLYVGNWMPHKGVDLFSPILARLGPDYELYYTADRRGRHTRYSLPPNAHCLGRLDAASLRRAYQQADALLFPSRSEGFALTVVEAMACGLPVIAAHSSSLPEAIDTGKTGLLCPTDDVDQFVAAARLLASDTGLWRRMRQASREWVVARCTERQQVDRYVRLYSALTDPSQKLDSLTEC